MPLKVPATYQGVNGCIHARAIRLMAPQVFLRERADVPEPDLQAPGGIVSSGGTVCTGGGKGVSSQPFSRICQPPPKAL